IHAKEPLAELWRINDAQLPEYINIEKNLSAVDKVIKPLLNKDYFAGTYVDVIKKELIIYTANNSAITPLLILPEVRPYRNLLSFVKVRASEANLKIKYDQIREMIDRVNEAFIQHVEPLRPIIIDTPDPSQNLKKRQTINQTILLGEEIINQNKNTSCTI
ncbi:2707_t:CDS:2, partial [Racocetra persica]